MIFLIATAVRPPNPQEIPMRSDQHLGIYVGDRTISPYNDAPDLPHPTNISYSRHAHIAYDAG